MFHATYLGWQSWAFHDDDHAILVDPLLVDEIGHGPPGTRQSFMFWPPRAFTFGRFPAASAVVLTHEHEDHFHIPSLARIDRRVPIHLSARSSVAARQALRALGFSVSLLSPGGEVAAGRFVLRLLGPSTPQPDEWDTLAFHLAHDDGLFFTNVDADLSPAMIASAERFADLAGLDPKEAIAYVHMQLARWDAELVRPGAGSSHGSAGRAPAKNLDEALEALRAGLAVRPAAGNSLVFRGGRLAGIDLTTPYLAPAAEIGGHTRKAFFASPGDPFVPSCGRTECSSAELDEIPTALDDLARYLYGTDLFARLMTLQPEALGDRRPTFVLSLQTGEDGATLSFAYCPEACSFAPVATPRDPGAEYVGHVTLWATDFACLARGECEPRGLSRSLRQGWAPAFEPFDFAHGVLWPFYHPLRHPTKCLRRYLARVAEAAETLVVIPHRT